MCRDIFSKLCILKLNSVSVESTQIVALPNSSSTLSASGHRIAGITPSNRGAGSLSTLGCAYLAFQISRRKEIGSDILHLVCTTYHGVKRACCSVGCPSLISSSHSRRYLLLLLLHAGRQAACCRSTSTNYLSHVHLLLSSFSKLTLVAYLNRIIICKLVLLVIALTLLLLLSTAVFLTCFQSTVV